MTLSSRNLSRGDVKGIVPPGSADGISWEAKHFNPISLPSPLKIALQLTTTTQKNLCFVFLTNRFRLNAFLADFLRNLERLELKARIVHQQCHFELRIFFQEVFCFTIFKTSLSELKFVIELKFFCSSLSKPFFYLEECCWLTRRCLVSQKIETRKRFSILTPIFAARRVSSYNKFD